jgi:hypothetical protein
MRAGKSQRAGVEFIDENVDGPGVCLRDRQRLKSLRLLALKT